MKRLPPHVIEPSETEGEFLQTIDGKSSWGPGPDVGLTVQEEGATVATGVAQVDFRGAAVTAEAGTGEVLVRVPLRVPLTTVVGGTPDLVWDANNELVITEVPT